jgi:m7GpppX diphosphatase
MTPDLNKFTFERVINEDAATHSLALLGSLPSPDDPQTKAQAIIRIEKTALDVNNAPFYFSSNTDNPGLLHRTQLAGHSDIVRKFVYL